MIQHRSNCLKAILGMLVLPGLLSVNDAALAASHTLRLDSDSNSRFVVENATVNGNETTVLFWTWPDLGDPNSGKECPLNFYSVTLRPGLESVQADTVAREVCGGIVAKGGVLDDGDGLIIARDRLERWRAGDQTSSQLFSSFDATSKLRVTTADYGAQLWDVSSSGNVVLAIPIGGYDAKDWPGVSLVMASLKADGQQRWQLKFSDVGETFSLEHLWAGTDGGALLHMAAHATGSMMPVIEPQLRFISASGKQTIFKMVKTEEQIDITAMRSGSQEDLQKFFEHQRKAKPEEIKTVAAQPRDGGGFDVLFHREGGAEGRAGHFLHQIGPQGNLLKETALGSHIEDHGLEDWFDFYVSGKQLVLLSRVMATQHGVNSRRKQWMQNAVSWIDLDTGAPHTRLIPLDMRYLEAAMNSGDEGRQYLKGLPGGEPVKLTSVGGVPLSVGIGYINGRNTLRLNEATEDLLAWNEAYEKQQKQLAKEQSSSQRKAERQVRAQEMNAELAQSVGMTPEEFSALSNRERKELMIRQGDPAAMQTLMEKQARNAQQAKASQQASTSPQDMSAQIAAAMVQAQAQMANDPRVTPEMKAQMAAIMAQTDQAGGQVTTNSGTSPAPSPGAASIAGSAPDPENMLALDAGGRAFLEYKNENGHAMTLLIHNYQTGQELMKKEYPDGVIYEYLDFSRFRQPLEQIRVTFSESGGGVVKKLTPVVSR